MEAVGKATIAQAKLRGRPIPDVSLDVAWPGGGLNFAERPTNTGRYEVKKPDLTKEEPPPAEPKAVPGRRPGLVSASSWPPGSSSRPTPPRRRSPTCT